MMNRFFLFFFMSVIVLTGSCKSAPVFSGAESDAEVVYKEGLHYLEKGDFATAEKRFMTVISDFSYSRFEPYATVALGDTYYYKKDYPSAVEVYSRFVKMRPSHEKTPWAELQIANSYFAQKPSNFFIFPNPSERDVETVEKAVAQYKLYFKKYPQDGNSESGLKSMEKAELVLIERDLRIAEFYSRKGKCSSVRSRLKYISENFSVSTDKNTKRIASLLKKCPEKIEEPENVK